MSGRPSGQYRKYTRGRIPVHTTISREFLDFLDKNHITISTALARGVRQLMSEKARA